jgi:hypothetical protein
MTRQLTSHTKKACVLLLSAWICLCLPPSMGYAAEPPVQNKPLMQAEEITENLVDSFVHKDFKTATKQVTAIRKQFHEMHKQLANRPFNERKERELAMMHAWVRVIAVAIRNRSSIGGAIAANQLSAALMRNQDFPDTVKSSIAWLDYLGREIVLLNMEDPKANANLLAIRRNEISSTWKHLRNLLLKDFRNKAVTMNVDHLVDHLETNLDPASQIADGKSLHDWVEKLEELPDPEKR